MEVAVKDKQSRNCRRKVRFRSENHARVVGSNHDVATWPYVCSVCGHWHLTSKPQATRPIGLGNSGIFS